MNSINLDSKSVDRALPRVLTGLAQYLKIQELFSQGDVDRDREFQRAFNRFYRVRRTKGWQKVFYRLLQQQKSKPIGFVGVLRRLHRVTGRVEASFASKLVATANPQAPVIDSVVLANVGLRLRPSGPPPLRLERAVDVHSSLTELFNVYLATPDGRYLVREFERRYTGSDVTDVKKLDLVLWQTRD